MSALPFAVLLPPMLGLAALPTMAPVRRLLLAAELSWLIRLQAFRVIGVVFLAGWAAGMLPAVFALPAAFGDIAVGLLAIPIARLAAARSPRARPAILLWSALGLSDFVVALATGFLSSPGRLQVLSLGHPNLFASAYPLVLIPTFGVPLFIILHAAVLWKLRLLAAASPEATGMTAPAAVA